LILKFQKLVRANFIPVVHLELDVLWIKLLNQLSEDILWGIVNCVGLSFAFKKETFEDSFQNWRVDAGNFIVNQEFLCVPPNDGSDQFFFRVPDQID